ncbi:MULTISPECIES: cytochrome aa3 quinol oxidase subunit II [Paenibacillus]|uniref:Quinol oxidase polypeptide II n=1 Tax=Paenibacillus lactis TaxID=228574 RepID=A0ABS4FG71_9BACL|nr:MULTISPECIES: cytochrome aa3 quinol oxidase subunit II [Paenibacillus]MBP1895256.1 cytochrome aa3-600 menaquinol oxidase subunit 2 [Paenibacillus lactis]HAF97735.1 cytochrome aa3 quinol oxidase subunit II [Paenibacillus lactis]
MNKRGPLFAMFVIFTLLLSGCSSLTVLNPKGPAARTLSDTIIFSILMMIGILVVVYVLYIFMLTKYRARKSNEGYEPPHEEGNKWLEILWTAIPIVIVAILSVVTVKTTVAVEKVPEGYENQKPLVIYASSSNWKWHFSYPEEGIETVNYVNIPTNRPIEFRLYSFGPITSFWIPQLHGQKYAMSDMVTKLNMVADEPGSMLGRNANFSGEGFAHMEFEALAMSPADYEEWVKDVKDTAPELTQDEFNKLLKTEHVGRMTFSTNHLEFSPPPEGHHHGGDSNGNEEHQGHKELHPDPATTEETEFDSESNVNPDEPLPTSPAEESSTHQHDGH